MNEIAHIRNDYRKMSLAAADLLPDPIRQFNLWLQQAIDSGEHEPTAMCLSTVTIDYKPDARIVLLKEVTNSGFVFFTNYESRKGIQLDHNPWASLTFFWPAMERQVRITGKTSKTDDKTSSDYFLSRPADSRAAAWLSPQSRPVSEEWIEAGRSAVAKKKVTSTDARPPHWGGFILTPESIEFWQGGANRLHDRLKYDRGSEGWEVVRLAP